MTEIATRQIPEVYRHKVSDIILTAISDGQLDADLDMLRNSAR